MALLDTHNFGSNHEGADGANSVSSPVLDGDFITFDGIDDGLYYGGDWGNESNIDIYAKFRVHNKYKGSYQVIWKDGGGTHGAGIALDDKGNIGFFGNNSSNRTSILISAENILENVWLEIYASKNKVQLVVFDTGEILDYVEGSVNPNNGSNNESIGYNYDSSPISDSADSAGFFDGDIDVIEIWDEYTLGFVPMPVTVFPINITKETAVLRGELKSLENYSVLSAYFEWGVDGEFNNTTPAETIETAPVEITEELNDLQYLNNYNYRFVVTSGTFTGYGDVYKFVCSDLIHEESSYSKSTDGYIFSEEGMVYSFVDMSLGTPTGGDAPANTIDGDLSTSSYYGSTVDTHDWYIDFEEGSEVKVDGFLMSVSTYADWYCVLKARNSSGEDWVTLSDDLPTPDQDTKEVFYKPTVSDYYRYYNIHFWRAGGASVLTFYEVKFLKIIENKIGFEAGELSNTSVGEKLTLSHSKGIYDFEEGNLEGWTVYHSDFMIKTNNVYEGSYSAGIENGSDVPENVAEIIPSTISGGVQITSFEFYWYETSSSTGGGIRLYDNNENPVIGVATDNPQWDIEDADGFKEVDGGGSYDTWYFVKIVFDWVGGLCDIHWEGSGKSEDYLDRPLINNTNIEKIKIKEQSGMVWGGDYRMYMWFDNISFALPRYVSQGYRISPDIMIPFPRSTGSLIAWDSYVPSGTSLEIETDISFDDGNTWEGWFSCVNSGVVYPILETSDLYNAVVRCKQTFTTSSGIDYMYTPELNSLGIYSVQEYYYFSGTTEIDDYYSSGVDVRLHRRDSKELIDSTYSTTSSGVFTVVSPHYDYHYLVALVPSGIGMYNAAVYDWLHPKDL